MWHALPQEIITKILGYTYCLQNKDLLVDIKNYNEIKEIVLDDYRNFWYEYDFGSDFRENMLLTDLLHFLQIHESFINGCVEVLPFHFRQVFLLQNVPTEEIYNSIKRFNNINNVKTRINILFGLMSPLTRQKFAKIYL